MHADVSLRPIYCYLCAKTLSWGDDFQPSCPEHGVLWPLIRNAPCAECVIIQDRRIMLIQRGFNPMKGYWAIPGGFSTYGETPSHTARREAAEETGLEVELDPTPLGVYIDSFPGDKYSEHRLVVSYIARPVGKSQLKDDEALAQDWYEIDQLPDNFLPNHQIRITDLKRRLATS